MTATTRLRITEEHSTWNETKNGTVMKGAFDKIYEVSKKTSVPMDFMAVANRYAADQYYVIGVGTRLLDHDVDVDMDTRRNLEWSLQMNGLLLFRNSVHPDSADVMEALKGATHRVPVEVFTTGRFCVWG